MHFLGCCKLFLLDVYLYVNTVLVAGIAMSSVFKGFHDVCEPSVMPATLWVSR